MLYAILCYTSESEVAAMPRKDEEAMMAGLMEINRKFAERGKLGPVVRLMPTTAATTVRYGKEPVVLDGPFAETKEQFLGFYVVDCESLDEAIEMAKELAGPHSHGTGAYEIRPVQYYNPGVGVK